MEELKRGYLSAGDHSRDSVGLKYVYPVVSRRAGGVSVGINLNTNNACNWRCIYCQVPDLVRGAAPPVDLALLEAELDRFLEAATTGSFMATRVPEGARRLMDVALSGNGEPTSSEAFDQVVEAIGRVLTRRGLDLTTRLITNGSLVARPAVQAGLTRLAGMGGEVWFKLDAGSAAGISRINGVSLSPDAVVLNLRRCAQLCPTWAQTCMFRYRGAAPSEAEIEAYLGLLESVDKGLLRGVLLYGLARPSMQAATAELSQLTGGELEAIAARIRALGLTVSVSA